MRNMLRILPPYHSERRLWTCTTDEPSLCCHLLPCSLAPQLTTPSERGSSDGYNFGTTWGVQVQGGGGAHFF